MKTSSKLIIVLGILAAFVVGLATGVPLATLLLVGALLGCPAMMFFGMGMHNHGAGGSSCPNCERRSQDRNHRNTASV
jgi:hypothetical protein